MRRYDIVTFDCYGTLIDWVAGITEAIAAAAARANHAVALEDVFPAYLRAEMEVESTNYRPYREVLAECGRRVATELGWSLADADADFLGASLGAWRPFADTNRALERLHSAGYRLGILSNVDDDLLAATRAHFTVDFDLIVTAQRVGSYKPAQGHFREARRRIGKARWLHAAQSHHHDIVPAVALDVPVVWVNRHREVLAPGAARPLKEVPDLKTLADWLAP
jgi:2-haloalkanoic acid dehalogenase type II